jgi:hypothetical protein
MATNSFLQVSKLRLLKLRLIICGRGQADEHAVSYYVSCIRARECHD